MDENAQVVEAPTLDMLKAQMQTAIAGGNDGEVVKLGKQIVKFKTDIEKREADKVKAEAESMAGDREKLAKSLLKTIKMAIDITALEAVKAKGFTFHLPDETSDIPYLGLMVPTVRKAGGGGGGGTGVTVSSQVGMPRHELIEKYATDAEKVAITKAREDATARGGNPNSSGWSAEKPVVKRILADNPQLIKR